MIRRETYCAVEALRMIIIIQSFNPSVASLNGEAACKAFCCEQFIPIVFTISFALLQEEWTVAEQFTAVGAFEAFGMELAADGVQAVALQDKQRIQLKFSNIFTFCCHSHLDFSIAFTAWWSQKLLEAIFTVQIAFLFDESNIDQFTLALWVDAEEVSWTPCFTQCSDEWSSAELCE